MKVRKLFIGAEMPSGDRIGERSGKFLQSYQGGPLDMVHQVGLRLREQIHVFWGVPYKGHGHSDAPVCGGDGVRDTGHGVYTSEPGGKVSGGSHHLEKMGERHSRNLRREDLSA